MGAENWAALGHHADHSAMGEDVRARLKAGAAMAPMPSPRPRRCASDAEIDALLQEADALVLPTLPIVPPTLEEADARAVVPLTRLVRPFNLSGHPAITCRSARRGACRRACNWSVGAGATHPCWLWRRVAEQIDFREKQA
jgi:amidase